MGRERLHELTQLLRNVNAGDDGAHDALAAAVNTELRAMARRRLVQRFGRDLPGVTIQPTMLADDTFMKLIRQRQKYDNTGHFFAIASQEMRRVLLDYCRQRKAAKRGGGAFRVTWNPDRHPPADQPDVGLEAFDEALGELDRLAPRKADVVKYRVLWGLSIEHTCAALGVGHATVERDWAFAKAWLARELAKTG